jgi:hypothetical protein
MKEFSEVVKGNISEEDLSRARYYLMIRYQ